jgi:Tol biopolymer transport system component
MPLASGTRLGPYEIRAPLGAGGMGEVYRASDTKLHRDVAIKVLPESFSHDADRMARFEREAHVLASLNHPNIASIYGVEDRALVMELVEGAAPRGPLPLEDALPIIHQLIDALEYAHEKGVVHRDLKPANIKITPEGRVKVLDFGLAKAMSEESAAPAGETAASPTLTMRATMAGVILGTAAYMAPEQARGHNVDRRADIWAFGVVVYELLTGKQLFDGPSISDTLAAVLKETPDLERVPHNVRKLLRLCLEKDPRKRLRDIGDARALLEVESEATPAAALQSRTRVLWPALTGVGLLAAAAIGIVHFRENPAAPSPMRFQVALPEKTAFAGHVAVSPDGTHIAFLATSADGRSLIWIRDLDRTDARPLAGTENGAYFFWSSDSRSLAFFDNDKLKRIEARGGPVLTICDATLPLDGTWNSDGTIVFGTTNRGLFRVSVSGGAAEEITKLDGPNETNNSHPVFLPGGRNLIYHIESNRLGEGAIYVTAYRAAGKLEKGKRVTLAQTGARYVPGPKHIGHLVFIRGEALMAQAFDESRLEAIGDAYPLAEPAGAFLARPLFGASWNGLIAYWSGGSVARSLAWFDRAGGRVGQSIEGNFFELSLSPDGERAAVGQRPLSADYEIAVVDLKRGSPMRIASDPRGLGAAVWSPDGTRLAFSTSGFGELRIKLASGAGEEEKIPDLQTGLKVPTDWSRDGKFIVFEHGTAPGSELWVYPIGGDRKPYLYLRHAASGRFSPDGKYVAYYSAEGGRSEVYVQEFPAGGGRWQISTAGGTHPRWKGDGKELYFTDADQNVLAVSVATSPKFQVVSTPRRLFYANPFRAVRPGLYRYDVSRDGQRFLVNTYQSAAVGQMNVILNWK